VVIFSQFSTGKRVRKGRRGGQEEKNEKNQKKDLIIFAFCVFLLVWNFVQKKEQNSILYELKGW